MSILSIVAGTLVVGSSIVCAFGIKDCPKPSKYALIALCLFLLLFGIFLVSVLRSGFQNIILDIFCSIFFVATVITCFIYRSKQK